MGGRRETVPAAETETAGGVLMKKNELGGLLLRLRKEAGLSQGLLCSGLCSVSRYARIEREELEPDFFLLDRLMGRLGKSVERLEYVMPLSVYRIYERRQDIQEAILHGKLDEAENLLDLYEKEKSAEGSLHRQYILQERAQLAWIREKDPDEILKLLDQAIGETMPSEEEMKKERCFSAEEGKLLLFRWEVSRKSRIANRDFEELKQLLRCICEQKTNRMDRSKIFPYASNGEMALYEFLSQLLSYGTYCIVGVLAVTGLETVTETLMEALDPLCRIVLLLCGALGVAKGALNAGALVVMLGYFYEYNELISDLKYMVTQLPVLRNLEERISVFYRDQESAEKEVLTVLPEGIEIENLHFSYENALGEVLRGLNIHIPLTGKIMLYGI